MSQHAALSEGRVAVITGAASGIGLAAATRFAAVAALIYQAYSTADTLTDEDLNRRAEEIAGFVTINDSGEPSASILVYWSSQ
jgi:NAD(P)-dependent dehydrogenase (short-subunit alcohol dehydrogenase family)